MKSKSGYCIQRADGGRVIAAVRREGRGRWHVDHCARVAAGEAPPAVLARALSRESRQVAWLLDDIEARSGLISLPVLKGKALERAVQGVVARGENVAPESLVVTFRAAPAQQSHGGERERRLDVFHLQAARSVIDEQVAQAAQWSVRPGVMLPAHLAMDLLYRRHGPEHDQHTAWNLVYVGQEASFLCISTREHVLLTRRLPQDLSQGADPDEYLGRLVTEIERSMFFARQTEHAPEITRIIVCGDHRRAPAIVERLARSGLPPALHWEVESLFVWGANVPGADDLPIVAGALLAVEGVPYNLSPRFREGILPPAVRRRGLVAVGAAAGVAVPLLLVGGLVVGRTQAEYLDRARGRLEEARQAATRAEAAYQTQRVLLAREKRIESFTAGRPDLESALRRLAAATPPTVVFKSVRVQDDETGAAVLHLEGESPAARGTEAQAAFVGFLASLRECEFATLVGEPRRMHIRPDEGREVGERTLFSLDLRLAPVTAREAF